MYYIKNLFLTFCSRVVKIHITYHTYILLNTIINIYDTFEYYWYFIFCPGGYYSKTQRVIYQIERRANTIYSDWMLSIQFNFKKSGHYIIRFL